MEQYSDIIGVALANIVWIVLYVWFLQSIIKLLNSIKKENRQIEPRKVWRMLIPVYNGYWFFIILNKVSLSILAEFKTNNIEISGKPAYSYGIIASIGINIYNIFEIAELTGVYITSYLSAFYTLTILAGYISGIIYWFKIVEYRNNIKSFVGIDTL